MTPEHELISKIMETGDIQTAIDWGMELEDFSGTDTVPVITQILAVHNDPSMAGAVIGPQVGQRLFPNWKFHADPGSTIPQLCQEVRKGRLARTFKHNLATAIEDVDIDLVGSYAKLEALVEMYRNLGVGRKVDVSKGEAYRVLLERYHRAQAGNIGIAPWPWEIMQKESGGLAIDEFAIFYGRPKSMKTWILCYLIWWFSVVCDLKILIYTKEMTTTDIFQRVAAFELRVAYQELRLGQLSENDFQVFLTIVEDAMNDRNPNLIGLSAKDVDGRDTPGWLRAKIRKYKPQLVAIDGIYKMSPENKRLLGAKDNEKVASIVRDVRQLTLDEGVPVIATSQANRSAAKNESANTDEASFSDAVGQETTLLARSIRRKDRPEIDLVVGASREWSLPGFRIHAQPAINFGYIGPLTQGEILKAIEDSEREATRENSEVPTGEPPPAQTPGRKRKRDAEEAKEVNDIASRATRGIR